MPIVDVSSLTDEDLETLRTQVWDETARRYRLASTPTQVEQMASRYLLDSGRDPGSEWVQPTGAHDAYPQGWTVTHNGKTWESLTPANVWAPGTSGWRQIGGGTTPAPWVQPTGAHDAYPKDALVTHNGKTWISTQDGNVWAPGVHGWTEVTP